MKYTMKKIDIKEFRELGYLQELNRNFLHPLGMALEFSVDEEGNEKLNGIWDYSDDDEGIHYDLKNSDNDRKHRFLKNAKYVQEKRSKRIKKRVDKLGFFIEPIYINSTNINAKFIEFNKAGCRQNINGSSASSFPEKAFQCSCCEEKANYIIGYENELLEKIDLCIECSLSYNKFLTTL